MLLQKLFPLENYFYSYYFVAFISSVLIIQYCQTHLLLSSTAVVFNQVFTVLKVSENALHSSVKKEKVHQRNDRHSKIRIFIVNCYKMIL
jgi:hypothetical protein